MHRNFTRPFSSGSFFIALAACCCFSTLALAQERLISGIVKSVEDESIVAGVNVVVKGTTIGTITNSDGGYSLTVPDQAEILVFTFIGLAPKEIAIGTQSVIDVAMDTDIKQ